MHFLSGILTILDQKERVRLFVLILLDVLVSALDVAFLAFTVIVINFYVKNAGLPNLSFLPSSLSDQNSILLISIFFILFGIKNAFAYKVSSSKFNFIYQVASRLSERNIRHYLKDDYLKFVSIDSSIHIRKICHQPIEFGQYILTNFQQIISQGVLIFFTIVAILFYHATLFLLLFLLLTPAVVLLGSLLKRKLKLVRKDIKRTNAETLQNVREALLGYIESNVYGKENFFAGRYADMQRQLNQNICTQQSLQALPSRMIELFAILGFFILIVINKWSAHTPTVDLLTIGVFMAAAYKIIPGLVTLLNSAGQMKTYEFTLNDLLPVDDQKEVPVIAKPADSIQSVEFKSVSFKYNDRPVLDDISFSMSPGDFAGVSGNSGRGKTTLVNLLLGFIYADHGTISVNNVETSSDERQHYWSRISYIKQQPFLIHDSVLKNITLSDGAHDANKLNEVITFCGLDTLLEQYPEGVNWIVTENGKNLSGGQRQRIMLARALYHGFDLLILDEPFGEMDQASEEAILSRLQLLTQQGKMILFITHNKSSLAYCNKIISLDE
ncbi:MAG TPA: ABC transporter ATP-binding protein [Mucilaginibacter sp.]|nr:ABC transporter ATP-binding protein [Mucilaginibacter sp.]